MKSLGGRRMHAECHVWNNYCVFVQTKAVNKVTGAVSISDLEAARFVFRIVLSL